MELELQHQTLEGYRTILDAPLAQEETLECIVPDALPDASRIVCAVGRAFLRGRQVGAASVRLRLRLGRRPPAAMCARTR